MGVVRHTDVRRSPDAGGAEPGMDGPRERSGKDSRQRGCELRRGGIHCRAEAMMIALVVAGVCVLGIVLGRLMSRPAAPTSGLEPTAWVGSEQR